MLVPQAEVSNKSESAPITSHVIPWYTSLSNLSNFTPSASSEFSYMLNIAELELNEEEPTFGPATPTIFCTSL